MTIMVSHADVPKCDHRVSQNGKAICDCFISALIETLANEGLTDGLDEADAIAAVVHDVDNSLAAQRPALNMQSTVADWHRKFGVPVSDTPAIRRPELRCSLIREEAEETCAAIEAGDLAEAIDGMCDLLYVTFGTAVEFGIDLAPFFAEVHRSNMEKVGGATRDDGKILKPEGWQKPRIAEMLAALKEGGE